MTSHITGGRLSNPRALSDASPVRDREDAEAIARAIRDAKRAVAKALPTPRQIMRYLSETEREGLLGAYQGRNGWRVQPQYTASLRPYGIVEAGGMNPNLDTHNYLTAFGMKVRREIIKEESDG